MGENLAADVCPHAVVLPYRVLFLNRPIRVVGCSLDPAEGSNGSIGVVDDDIPDLEGPHVGPVNEGLPMLVLLGRPKIAAL